MQPQKKFNAGFVNHFLYVFKAPIITAPRYENTITYDMRSKTIQYRLVEINNIDENKSTDYEAMLYLHTASFENPLSHSWYKLYVHTFSKYHNIKQILGNEPMEKIHENEFEYLNDLKSWIYNKQIKHLKQHLV